MFKSKEISIFLVDDDNMYLQMLEDQLKQNQKLKTRIKTFASGEECLNNLHLDPHIIVLDYYLNKDNAQAKNGIEILQLIKQKNPEIQVVMLSGQDKIEIAVNTIRNGAFDYVIKSESAFLRTQNIITNIHSNMRLKDLLKLQKLMTRWSFGMVAAIILVVMILYVFFPQIWALK